MIVGIPKEVKTDEYRVAITPAGVRELTSAGHTGVHRARRRRGFVHARRGLRPHRGRDHQGCRRHLGRRRPGVQGEGAGTRGVPPARGPRRARSSSPTCTWPPRRSAPMRSSPAATSASPTRRCAQADNSLPLLAPMSEVAGRMAPLMGSHHLMRPGGGRGVLVCGVPGVLAARVVILGAGVVGMAAATMAVGMHSDVFVLDRNLDRLRQFDHHFRGALETVASSQHAIEEICVDADIVIGAVLVVGARAPMLVSDDLVAQMRDGSVLVDISVDQGGCFESTRPTTHTDPTYEVNGCDLLLRRQHAGSGAAHVHPRIVQRHLALRAAHRQPRLEGRSPVRPRVGRRGQCGERAGCLPAGGRRPRTSLHAVGEAHRLTRPCAQLAPATIGVVPENVTGRTKSWRLCG